jgi:hypothetical protein
MLMIRLIRGRALIAFSVAAAVAFTWLQRAAEGVSLAGAVGLVVVVFSLAVWKLAAQDDPHWWRSGVSTLGLVAIVGSFISQPTRSGPLSYVYGVIRLNAGVILWWTLAPLALVLARSRAAGKIAQMRPRLSPQTSDDTTGRRVSTTA